MISARGAPGKPILLTSAAPVPVAGAWMGVELSTLADAANALDWVEVHYAGGPSQADGAHCDPDGSFSRSEDSAISIYAQPSGEIVTNTAVVDSAGTGINLAYFGDYIDFKTTNTFTSVVGCKVTRPRPKVGACSAQDCP